MSDKQSVEERLSAGAGRRKRVARSQLGELHNQKRTCESIAPLLNATEGRVPSLLKIKYARMSTGPFAFFRGAVSIMAADFSKEPNTGLTVQLCGDAHLQNLGCFETPDGRLAFDINDFDETAPGPWEWDVKRMATSVILAGEASRHIPADCRRAAETFVASYCETLSALADQPVLQAARHQIHRAKKSGALTAAWEQAARATPCDLLSKYTETDAHGGTQFREIENQIWRSSGTERVKVLKSLPSYRKSLPPERLHLFNLFEPVDVAFKIVGTGSVGLRDYVVLMFGNGAEDPLFLQIKQEVSSAYAPYLKNMRFPHQGQRVVLGQRRIQPASDLILGWTRIGEHDYLVRQLNDHKGRIDLTNLPEEELINLAVVAGELLARGHARSGDAVNIKGYIGGADKVVQAIARYAVAYAEVTHRDFEIFTRVLKDGKLKAAG